MRNRESVPLNSQNLLRYWNLQKNIPTQSHVRPKRGSMLLGKYFVQRWELGVLMISDIVKNFSKDILSIWDIPAPKAQLI